ncbi:MAG: excinuclease ABC subunit A [Candidatus Fischerbacteria bacterium RBG_13_37_8]|uniref:UvrABC system protein A n=1 Tax=Candidatus Fischerbacteria bacterium RBG_13_37_8 TaxID=1817863 RepID=A0A1F5VDC2_9BACT|nr:MAG: excinuclease ABC subunit A [Candidatus Fischerbacteria bacterium RBG_13_37_8]
MNKIIVTGARHNNLKGIQIKIPRNKIVVITGLSGSGKSSLAFDTVFAEGQRKYIETLSPFARQFVNQLEKPEVDKIEGLSPSVAIEQRTLGRSVRSTVATISGVYDYLRLLYARASDIYCPQCGTLMQFHESEEVIHQFIASAEGMPVIVLAPVIRGRKGEHKKLLEDFIKRGFLECRIDGVQYYLQEAPELDRHKIHHIDIIIDKLKMKPDVYQRLKNAIDTAKKYANNIFALHLPSLNQDRMYVPRGVCTNCNALLPEIEPKLFSFNSPVGACPRCKGLGKIIEAENDLLKEKNNDYNAGEKCPECNGNRLRKESSIAKVGGLDIVSLCSREIKDIIPFMQSLHFKGSKAEIASKIMKDVINKLVFLKKVGLGYLAIERPLYTLSLGEAQRVRLASHIGSELRGILYVLDEPTIGLHPSDNAQLLSMLKLLKEKGNTILIVEHDETTIRTSDYVIDLGPGAGSEGGHIVNKGSLSNFLKKDSLTACYLTGKKTIPVPQRRRKAKEYITIKGAREYNLKNITAKVPLGVMTVVTGVSGSGKSTLVIDILYRYIMSRIYKTRIQPGQVDTVTGWEKLKRIVLVDQSPIGKTPRSTPATYTGIWTPIREFFARLPESRKYGYTASRFSYNVASGRCSNCEGLGMKKIIMAFMPDSYVTCEECKGARFNKETLKVRYEGKSINDVLELTIAEAFKLFSFHPKIKKKLQFLLDTALGYLKLGQPSTSLSGGEAQRIKLARELWSSHQQNTLYILDEPTTGLHFQDVHYLLQVLQKLVDYGHTIVIIEHNVEVMKSADYIIDLGPGAGEEGGHLVVFGTPEKVANSKKGATANFIKKVLNTNKRNKVN